MTNSPDTQEPQSLTVLTAGTCNRLAGMRAVLNSVWRHHPGIRLKAAMVDRVPCCAPSFDVPVDMIRAEEIDLPGGRRFLFQYPPFELCCALKPFLIRACLAEPGVSRVVYLDSDMLVLQPFLDLLEKGWRTHDILLTPHLLRFPADADAESQLEITRHGAYNAGFLAVQKSRESADFLSWWSRVLADRCTVDPEGGVAEDQRWLDFAASVSDAFGVVRDPGMNVGYWNLHERAISRDDTGRWLVNGDPLRLFHFSGFDARRLSAKALVTDAPARAMARLYAGILAEGGDASWRLLPYGWARYTSGEPIKTPERDVILSGHPEFADVADPFALPEQPARWAAFREAAQRQEPVRFTERVKLWRETAARLDARFGRLERGWDAVKRHPFWGLLWDTARTLGGRNAWRGTPSATAGPGAARSVAVVYDWAPYPARSGDNKRVGEMIRILRENGFAVHLVLTDLVSRTARDECLRHVDMLHTYVARHRLGTWWRYTDRKLRGLLYRILLSRCMGRNRRLAIRLFSGMPSYIKGMDRFLAERAAQYHWKAVIVNFTWLHPAVDRLPAGTLRLLDTIDLQHKRNEEFASRGLKGVARLSRREEADIFRKFDAVIAIQKEEAAEIRDMCPGLRVMTAGTSAMPERAAVGPPVPKQILYVGGYNPANVDGLTRFLSSVWPEVHEAEPDAVLRVCGHVRHAFSDHAFPGVVFCGHVQDLEQEYAAAELTVNPIWVGTGLKIKTVEALARGKCLVTTSKGIEGMEDVKGTCLVRDDDRSFAAAVVDVLRSEETRQTLCRAARRYAATHLSPAHVYAEFLDYLDETGVSG